MKPNLLKVLSATLVAILFSSTALPGTAYAMPTTQENHGAIQTDISLPKEHELQAPLTSTAIGNWSGLGSNPTGTDGALSYSSAPGVYDIAIVGTDVYAAGCFTDAGGDPTADFIAKWDTLTESWSGLGNDGGVTPNGALKNCVLTLAVNATDVYVGGIPTLWVNGAPAPQGNQVAKWDGSSWTGLGGDGAGGSSLNGPVYALEVSGSDIYVGGYFTDVKNGSTTLTEADYIAKWDTLTGNWSALGNNGSGNGAIQPISGRAGIQAIAIDGTNIYAGGYFDKVYNGLNAVPESAFIARWNGTEWSALGSRGVSHPAGFGPISNSVWALAVSGNNVYVGGDFRDVTQNNVTLTVADYLAKWDTLTETWSALGSDGNGNGSLNSTLGPNILVNGGNVYVTGAFTNVNNNGTVLTAADYVAKWDGANWSALGSNGSSNGSLNTYAYALGLLGNQLLVGGDFANVNNNGTVLNTADYIAAYTTNATISPGETVRVSVSSNGTQGDGHSAFPSTSGDGRYIAFISSSTNLVPSDTNGDYDVFIFDMQTGVTMLASVNSSSVQANSGSYYPSISADGRYVVFYSRATNLVPADTNGVSDVFVHDMQTGVTTRVSVDSSNTQANNYSIDPRISGDGRYITFGSAATNLVPDDTNEMYDIFVYDRQTSTTTRASVDSNGVQANAGSGAPFISADGRYIEFSSGATNLVPGDTNGVTDIFVHDMQTGMTKRISVDSNGAQGNGFSYDHASISADNRYVAYISDATNLVPGDTNGTDDIFLYDMQTGVTTRISVSSDGVQANGPSYSPSVSADGRFITFTSSATNLITGDTNDKRDIFIYDRQTGMTGLASVDSNGIQSNGYNTDDPQISADGRFIVFRSSATNLVVGDTNLRDDIFLHRQEILPIPPTSTPTYTPTHTPTFTLTSTPTSTPTFTPTLTPTNSPTPVTGCNQITAGPITLSRNSMNMAITNPLTVPIQIQDVFVIWNDDRGHMFGSDKSLILQSASLGGVNFWTGEVSNQSTYTIIPAQTTYIPTGPSAITFTFHQSYDSFDDTEQIIINLATNGCQAYPITSSGVATNTPTVTPTFTATPTPVVHTLVLQPDAAAGVDSYIYSAGKNTNYGATVAMEVGEDNDVNNRVARSLIKFDLSSIPANATITSATLSLWTSSDLSSNTRNIQVYRLKVPFNENQVTWMASATGVNWQAAGASGANDRESTSIGSVTILDNEALNLEKQIGLTPAKIQEMVNGTFLNRGFIIVADTESNDRFNYHTSDSTNSSQRPKLVVQYIVPAVVPSNTPTQTASPTSTFTSTAIFVPSITPTLTATASRTPTAATLTPTFTATFTPTITRTSTNTASPTNTVTPGPSVTPTNTGKASTPATPTASATSSRTATSTSTFTPVLPTSTFTSTFTSVPPTATFTPTLTGLPPTATVTPTFTSQPPTATQTSTPTPTITSTSVPGFPSTIVLDNFNRANGALGKNWSGATTGYAIASNTLDVGTGDALFWKVASFGSNQEVFITLTTVDAAGSELDLLLKSQSATTWSSGVIKVSYNPIAHTVQVWTYSSAQGWVQRGADIPVTFGNGDQFGARAKSNGTVEIYRNGALIGSRDASGWTYSANGGYIGLWFINASNAIVDDFGGGTIAP